MKLLLLLVTGIVGFFFPPMWFFTAFIAMFD